MSFISGFHRSAKSLPRLLPFALLLFMLLCAAGGYAQKTIHVPADQPTIQAGLDAAGDGDTVLVSDGTYDGNIIFGGKNVTLTSVNGPSKTTITGENAYYCGVCFQNNESRLAVLSGFTITAAAQWGVQAYASSPTIRGNVISGNSFAGGIALFDSTALVTANVITNNRAGISSNSDFGFEQGAVIVGNTITNNSYFGAISDTGGVSVIADNVISNNQAMTGGSAISTGGTLDEGPDLFIANNLITGNVSQGGAAALDMSSGPRFVEPFHQYVVNNTIADNTNTGTPGAQLSIRAYTGTFLVSNNIIVGNKNAPAFICDQTLNGPPLEPPSVSHNDIYPRAGNEYQGTCTDTTGSYGNIAVNPMFADEGAGNYQLAAGSPAIDAGTNSAVRWIQNNLVSPGYDVTLDLPGNARFEDATGKGYSLIDMGAYEYPGTAEALTANVLTANQYTLTFDQPAVLNVQVSAVPSAVITGDGELYDDGAPLMPFDLAGTGTVSLEVQNLTPGFHEFYAVYNGGPGLGAADSVPIWIAVSGTSSVWLKTNPNPVYTYQPFTLNVQVAAASNASHRPAASAVPTGQVTFTENGSPAFSPCSLDSSGACSETATLSNAGTYALQADYSGDSNYTSAQSNVVQEVVSLRPTSTTLVVSPNPAAPMQMVTLSATVADVSGATGTPEYSGTVTFTDGGAVIGTASVGSNGVASAQFQFAAGTHQIVASYGGNSALTASASPAVALVVNLPATATSLSVSPNPAVVGSTVTMTATVSSNGSAVTTGTVQFYDGTALLGQAALRGGSATYSTNGLTIGTHAIHAQFVASGSFAASTSPVVDEQIIPYVGTFSISVTPTGTSLYTGEATSATATVTPQGGFNYPVQLSCTGLPANTTCMLAADQVAAGGGAVTFTIQTTAPHPVTASLNRWKAVSGIAFALLIPLVPRRRRRTLWVLWVAMIGLPVIIGCGAPGPDTGGTPPGTYTITIQGTGGPQGYAATSSAPFSLTVKSLFR